MREITEEYTCVNKLCESNRHYIHLSSLGNILTCVECGAGFRLLQKDSLFGSALYEASLDEEEDDYS